MSKQIVEIMGIVDNVTYLKLGIRFTIQCKSVKDPFLVESSFFCPLQKGDKVIAKCLKDDTLFKLLRLPATLLPTDSYNIINVFLKSKVKFDTCTLLSNRLAIKFSSNNENICTFLSEQADYLNNDELGTMDHIVDVKVPDYYKILKTWYKERNIRSLYLFGFKLKEIKSSCIPTHKLYKQCFINPFTISCISINTAMDICKILEIPINKEDVFKSKIMHHVVSAKNNKGWSFIDKLDIVKTFGNIEPYIESLQKDYNITFDDDKIYDTVYNNAENYLVDFIQKLMKNKYEYKHIEPIYNVNTSPDQKEAISNAINLPVSIITGGAGSGKCLAPGTKVLMYDGSIKRVEMLKIGDLLMGPDSKPRTILGTCYGSENMYEITPLIGKSFTCNEPHVLTLIGEKPFVINKRAYLTRQGHMYTRDFDTSILAHEYVEKIKPDIFDMPLNVYLKRFKNMSCYLYNTGVDFPEIKLVVNPYTAGHSITSHISDIFKINNRENRINLLSGIIDRYGIIHHDHITIILENKRAIKDTLYVARSLGLLAKFEDYKIYIYGKDIRNLNIKAYPQTCIDMLQEFIVVSKGIGEYYGFTLDGDGRFLLDSFTVTHNTTCLNTILNTMDHEKIPYIVCSFTGKAVHRIREVTKRNTPTTIHLLLRKTMLVMPHTIIVDEFSMLDVQLLSRLLVKCKGTKQLIFIGDNNQLQPINCGCLLNEMIKSLVIPVFHLTINHRIYTITGQVDGILMNANNMLLCKEYSFSFTNTDNFFVLKGNIDRVEEITKLFFESKILSNNFVILHPFNINLKTINNIVQDIYQKESKSIKDENGTLWKVGDSVMVNENDYDHNIFNGENGVIIDIIETMVKVKFNTQKSLLFNTVMDIDDLMTLPTTKLIHSYAITIDKSQGSEWDYVIVYLDQDKVTPFINKNKIYTAITRAKRACWCIVKDVGVFSRMAVLSLKKRNESFGDKLGTVLPTLYTPFVEEYVDCNECDDYDLSVYGEYE